MEVRAKAYANTGVTRGLGLGPNLLNLTVTPNQIPNPKATPNSIFNSELLPKFIMYMKRNL